MVKRKAATNPDQMCGAGADSLKFGCIGENSFFDVPAFHDLHQPTGPGATDNVHVKFQVGFKKLLNLPLAGQVVELVVQIRQLPLLGGRRLLHKQPAGLTLQPPADAIQLLQVFHG